MPKKLSKEQLARKKELEKKGYLKAVDKAYEESKAEIAAEENRVKKEEMKIRTDAMLKNVEASTARVEQLAYEYWNKFKKLEESDAAAAERFLNMWALMDNMHNVSKQYLDLLVSQQAMSEMFDSLKESNDIFSQLMGPIENGTGTVKDIKKNLKRFKKVVNRMQCDVKHLKNALSGVFKNRSLFTIKEKKSLSRTKAKLNDQIFKYEQSHKAGSNGDVDDQNGSTPKQEGGNGLNLSNPGEV